MNNNRKRDRITLWAGTGLAILSVAGIAAGTFMDMDIAQAVHSPNSVLADHHHSRAVPVYGSLGPVYGSYLPSGEKFGYAEKDSMDCHLRLSRSFNECDMFVVDVCG